MSDFSVPNLLTPEIVPGGYLQSPLDEERWKQVQDVINNLYETVNNLTISDDDTTILVGSGGMSHLDVIAHTSVGVSANLPLFGNQQLQATHDGQLVVGWLEYTGSGNNWKHRFLKAESPFKQWTNLAGDSASPTEIPVTTPAGGSNAPCFCCDPDTGNLYAFTMNSSREWQCHCFPFLGDGAWDESYNSVVIETYADTKFSSLPGCTVVGGNLFFASRKAGSGAGSDVVIYQGTPTITTSTGWGALLNIRGVYDGSTRADFSTVNEQTRFAYVGNGILLCLFDWSDSSVRGNIGYTVSTDYGETWGYRDTSGGGYYLEYNEATSGNVITLSASGTNVGSDMKTTGTGTLVHSTWGAQSYRGDKVGATYVEGRTSSSDAGIRYAEWTLGDGFTATGDHITLTTNRNAKANEVVTEGDIVRAFWLEYHAFTSTVRFYGVSYRRVVADGEATDLMDWQIERQVLTHPADNSADAIAGFNASSGGWVQISNQYFLPVILARSNNDVSANSAILFRLLSVNLMDGN